MNTVDVNAHCGGLFLHRHNHGGWQFLGSAFMFRHGGAVLGATADHCIEDVEGQGQLVIATPGDTGEAFKLDIAKRAPKHDLCLLMPVDEVPGVHMRLSEDKDKIVNIDFYTLEFSTTTIKDGQFDLRPATRVGNCIRTVDETEFLGPAGDEMLEMSYPALQGASGSAVIQMGVTRLPPAGVSIFSGI